MKNAESKGNKLLWIVAAAFVVQICAWSTFFYFANKTNPQMIKVEKQPAAAP